MSDPLVEAVGRDLAAPVPDAVRALARRLGVAAGARAALFYGSVLRTGDLDGVLDFYLLTPGPPARGIWPRVSYHEIDIAGLTLRAKVATMPLATFARAAKGQGIDTTIWTRFVQPAAIAWQNDERITGEVAEAIADAVATGARFAAALGPAEGVADDYWRALFRATYAAELRMEARGREEQILAHGGGRYATLLPMGWARGGITFGADGERLRPDLAPARRRAILTAWRRRRSLGKPLNIARLVKAAFTFEGAAAYAAWKIERHTGVPVVLTPWRERHPILAAPGVLWRVWRR